MTIYALDDRIPALAGSAWVAPDANVIGSCVLEEDSSVWFGATLRGDNEEIRLGAGSNIQENTVCHTDMGFPMHIGTNVTVGHKAMLHGCVIGDNSLIGMGAIVLNGAKIGRNCLIGAGALVTEGREIPDNSMVLGAPGKVVKELGPDWEQRLRASALHYQENARRFRAGLRAL
ncbi:Carbonic anhydrase or acetyltransferase, isoleucine patch superfamily [Pseudooceanicola antarcticus]|uniref:Carbonic anhydrase or acetyltransferase, isoleucine patch superfamily n=1 Tax=Pseudooceanicola antarcticus TaxID=1247613 RepID=A0A285IXV2_9RHOB|nr:gamma carbonic anhydrase family protein [Pseudooceanicola antarcticus]PJE25783.1 gamma carbonic anhydrase family protein [Pseudooceanicola antarcticus]SNY52875.1 Carbonic anhydrase or acetyltransferase, isoleucine patch superfamily [Pseudooceanicola antarcticus]